MSAGGICVTRAVRDHVHGRLDLAFQEIGALNLKNIARPVEAFVVRLRPTRARPGPLVHDTGGKPCRCRVSRRLLYWRSPT